MTNNLENTDESPEEILANSLKRDKRVRYICYTGVIAALGMIFSADKLEFPILTYIGIGTMAVSGMAYPIYTIINEIQTYREYYNHPRSRKD